MKSYWRSISGQVYEFPEDWSPNPKFPYGWERVTREVYVEYMRSLGRRV